jgi:hypothetical protein
VPRRPSRVIRPAHLVALVLGAVNVVLVMWAQPLFGASWKYVMWEGGILEDLTAVQFIVGGLVFGWCALRRDSPGGHRGWFGMYALAMLVLAGEETNYGTGTLFLDLGAPNFAQTYNPQANNLHNYLIEAYIPVLALGVMCLVLRVFYERICPRFGLPMSKDFLEAVVITGAFIVFMVPGFRDERFLSVDEVYEWSCSLLLLCLALYYRFGWVFRPRSGEVGCGPGAIRWGDRRA